MARDAVTGSSQILTALDLRRLGACCGGQKQTDDERGDKSSVLYFRQGEIAEHG